MLRSLRFHFCFLWALILTTPGLVAESVEDTVGTKFRLIDGGRFVQGTSGGERELKKSFPLSTAGQFYGNAEGPAHVTWITKPYYIAETEVTVAQFREFVKATGHLTSAQQDGAEMVGWDPTPEDKPLYQSHDFLRDSRFNWQAPGFDQGDHHPVVGVSWSDAKAYCEWLSEKEGVRYRLPTEAEWEFACRAGTSTWFSFGDRAKGVVHKFGNLGNVELERHRSHAAERQWLLDFENDPDDGYVFTAPVGTYEANPWGLHDMHGNAWEWCEDLWLDTVYKDFNRPKYDQPHGTAVDPVNLDRPQTPANDFHTIRGGCWYNGDLICRSSGRTYWDRDDAACYIGFRVARDVGQGGSTVAKQAYESWQLAVERIKAAGGNLYSSRGIDIEVRFEGDSFDEAALQSLKLIPDLQRLRIGWRQRDGFLSQAGVDAIADLSELRSLEFSGALDPNAVDLSSLSRLGSLEVLRFPRSAPLNDGHLAAIRELTSLREFQCFGTSGGLTDGGISQLSSNRDLSVLHVHENQATGSFLKSFIGCPLHGLSSTRLHNGEGTLTEENAHVLSQFKELTSLTLSGQSLLGENSLSAIGTLSKLRTLYLDECAGFADDDFSAIANLRSLQELNLESTNAGDIAAAAISQIPRLRKLQIRNDHLTDIGLTRLASAFSIEELRIDSDVVTDEGLESLQRMNRLQKLTLASESVIGSGLKGIVKLPELREVSLMTPALQDIAFDYLSTAKSVQKLKLAHRGYKPPAALSDLGMMKMAKATWVKEIWLPRNDTAMTEEQMNELNSLMPKTNVIVYTVAWPK